jgi:precorrin-8X/cobalt-precorrin-8 methylmutase
MDYIRNPQAIYERSFAIIRSEADLSRFSVQEQAITIRMIHACGMTDIVGDLIIGAGFVAAALGALRAGKSIFVDAEMVKHGIIVRSLSTRNEIICTLNDPRAREIGMAQGITRSAAAVELWQPGLEGALVVIGNAPTALFHLLELIDAGSPKPAAIIACPVGFVGAAESKAEIAAHSPGIPFLTIKGRRGGSAMAAAVVNALTGDIP